MNDISKRLYKKILGIRAGIVDRLESSRLSFLLSEDKIAVLHIRRFYDFRYPIVQKRYIPHKLLKYVERKTKIKLKMVPRFFTFTSKNSADVHSCMDKDMAKTIIGSDFDKSKFAYYLRNAYVLMPLPVFNDRRLRKIVLIHELTEVVIHQWLLDNICPDGYSHDVACDVEECFINRYGWKSNDVIKRGRQMMKNPANWGNVSGCQEG